MRVCGGDVYESVARSAWRSAEFSMSLFASLLGCDCPVLERLPGFEHYNGCPPLNWFPTSDELEKFSAIQIERRCGPQ